MFGGSGTILAQAANSAGERLTADRRRVRSNSARRRQNGNAEPEVATYGGAQLDWGREVEPEMKNSATVESASARIDERIKELGDWRGKTLATVRRLIHDADPGIVEEWKWVKATSSGTPVWSHDGIVCTGESYKQAVKLTFARGASIPDPKKLFNSSLEGGTRRAIDLREGEEIDQAAFRKLIRAAVEINSAARAQRSTRKYAGERRGA